MLHPVIILFNAGVDPACSFVRLRSIEYDPEFFTTVSRPPQAYGGHAFIIEAGVAYGSKKRKLRRARRIREEEEISEGKDESELILGPI